MATPARAERPRRRAVPLRRLLLVGAIALVPPSVLLAFVKHFGPPKLQVAQGAISGNFHPIAGNFRVDDTRLSDCHGGNYPCYEQAFGNLAFREGPRPALKLFARRMATSGSVRVDCHRIAHTIGSASLARYHGNVARTFSEGAATCASGYYHGILERAFVGLGTVAELSSAARRLCSGGGIRPYGFLDYQCNHGLGHGLMLQSGYDLPTALSVCHGLATHWNEVSCTGGVFMENLDTRFGFRSRWVRAHEPLYPCTSVKVRYRRSCYLRVTSHVLQTNGRDWAATARTCARVAPRWSRYCFRSLGRDAAGLNGYRADRILATCGLAGARAADCLYGAARSDGDRFASPLQASRLCAAAAIADRAACYSGMGITVGLLNPTSAARRSACAALAPGYLRACAQAARAEVAPDGLGTWG